MLKKILFSHQSKVQLYSSLLGTLIGFVFLTTSVHFLTQFSKSKKENEMLDESTLVIQRKVGTLNILNLVKSDFSEEDILEFQREDFISSVEPIKNNNFDISIQTDSELVPYFRSDIFVQSVSADFLGINSLFWEWSPQNDYVPVVLPKDFLIMLNTFASAKGLPHISEDLAQSINFKFRVEKGKEKEEFKVKIIGFTSKISSILVPPSFMDYGNQYYASASSEKVTQLIVTGAKGQFGQLETFLKEKNLESKESEMLIGKMKSIGTLIFSILTGIALLLLLLAGLLSIQYAQLIISRKKYEINTLLLIGYSSTQIVGIFMKRLLFLFSLFTLLSFILYLFLQSFLNQILSNSGLFLENQISGIAVLALILSFALYMLGNFWNLRRSIRIQV